MKPTKSHGGKRIPGPGKKIGRPSAGFSVFLKKLRATEEEREDFFSMLTGNARKDFLLIFNALKKSRQNDQ